MRGRTADPRPQRQRRSSRVKELALEAGFDLVGITSAEPFERERRALAERIDAGLFDGLPWFTRQRAQVAAIPAPCSPRRGPSLPG